MDLKEYPHACCPANLSCLSDYVLGALACSDMELNCAAGIWWSEIALWVCSHTWATWYCYASILPFQNCSGMLTVFCPRDVDSVDRGQIRHRKTDVDMQPCFQQEITESVAVVMPTLKKKPYVEIGKSNNWILKSVWGVLSVKWQYFSVFGRHMF